MNRDVIFAVWFAERENEKSCDVDYYVDFCILAFYTLRARITSTYIYLNTIEVQ